jgi:hypothetical protein
VGFRGRAALAQLTVFCVGGVLGPVWHLAHHRNDHSHGPDGQAVAFDLGAAVPFHGHPQPPRPKPPGEPAPAARAHAHPHHPHSHSAAHAHAPRATLAEPHQEVARAPLTTGAPQASPASSPLDHGHGSLAHLGLALLGTPALLPLPTPEPGEWVRAGARIAAPTLFRPSFPLPRPPPPARAV